MIDRFAGPAPCCRVPALAREKAERRVATEEQKDDREPGAKAEPEKAMASPVSEEAASTPAGEIPHPVTDASAPKAEAAPSDDSDEEDDGEEDEPKAAPATAAAASGDDEDDED